MKFVVTFFIGKLFPGRDGGGILDSLVRSLGGDSRYGIPSMDLANVGEFDGFDDLTFGSEGGRIKSSGFLGFDHRVLD